MTSVLRAVFGARGQVVAGIVMAAVTVGQTVWWTWVSPPSLYDVFLVSMEALLWGAFNQVVGQFDFVTKVSQSGT